MIRNEPHHHYRSLNNEFRRQLHLSHLNSTHHCLLKQTNIACSLPPPISQYPALPHQRPNPDHEPSRHLPQTPPPLRSMQPPLNDRTFHSHPPRPYVNHNFFPNPNGSFFTSEYNRSYASAVRATPPLHNSYASVTCTYCGEPNHSGHACRHGFQLQCRRCFQFGHKEKMCQY